MQAIMATGFASMVGRSIGFVDVMRRAVVTDDEVIFAEAPDPICRASVTVLRRDLLARLKTAANGDAVRVSVNGSVDVSTLFGSRQHQSRSVAADGTVTIADELSWSPPEYALSTRDDWERQGDVCAVVDDVSQLVKLLTKCKTETVQLDLWRNTETADCGILVKTDSAEFELTATDAQNFPDAPALQTDSVVLVDSAALCHALEQTVYCTDAESTRYALGAVLVELREDGITLAATDSRRLAKIDLTGERCGGFAAASACLPWQAMELAISQLKKTSGAVALAIQPTGVDSGFTIEAEAWTLRGKIIDGRFPDFRKVIPENFAHYVKADRAELLEALETVQLTGSDESRGCDFTFDADGRLTLVMQGRGRGRILVKSAESAVHGKRVDCITFDPKYVAEYLKHADGAEVVIALVAHDTAAVIECENCATYVLMPLSRDR